MLLQRLVEKGEQNRESRPFHQQRRLDWMLDLDRDGRPRGTTLVPLVEEGRGRKPRGVLHDVPAVVRTVGVAANLGADDVQYILGWADLDSKPDRIADCARASADLHQRWADSDEGRNDRVAVAVAAFFRNHGADGLTRPEGCAAKQGVLICVDGVPATQTSSVVPFWTAEVVRRKGGNRVGICLVCGRSASLLDTVPAKLPARYAPGAGNDVALVSVNERVFGYDLVTGLAATPICMTCGNAMAVGLHDILSGPDVISLPGQSSRLAWWYTEPVSDDYMDLAIRADPQEVHDLLKGARAGVPRNLGLDATRFCSMTVSGNNARLVVRGWFEMPLLQLHESVVAWFRDSGIDDGFHPSEWYHPLHTFVRVTGRWMRARKRYAEQGEAGADRPEQIQHDLLHAMMFAERPIPPSVLIHLLHRVQTDAHVGPARAALIRLCLLRTYSNLERKLMPGLDPANTNPYYVAGRIFAMLDNLQRTTARRTDTILNATFADRFFGGAPANPRVALQTGRRDAQAWLSKLRRSRKGQFAGLAAHLAAELDATYALLDADQGVPGRASVREQGLFVLGYHHQRAYRAQSDPSGCANIDQTD